MFHLLIIILLFFLESLTWLSLIISASKIIIKKCIRKVDKIWKNVSFDFGSFIPYFQNFPDFESFNDVYWSKIILIDWEIKRKDNIDQKRVDDNVEIHIYW
jgi:hypothetical protein